uniref:Formin like 1 n=1 Tax=Astyanax mexicanus TaxID=7994 RepID=A0A8B9H341_ASTMX
VSTTFERTFYKNQKKMSFKNQLYNIDHYNNILGKSLECAQSELLCQYDNEKKWELVCDQERFQVKNPPSAYLQKLKSFIEQGGSRKVCFKRRVQEATQVLRELEISLRTNHIGWAQEFLSEENKGLDVLVDYLSFAQRAVPYDLESTDNSSFEDKSVEDLTSSATNSPTHNSSRPNRSLTSRLNSFHHRKVQRNLRLVSQKDHLHLCIMCLRAIMNYQSGFNQVMNHPQCVNEITLSLNNNSARTKALVLELLAAVCLVRGGHDIIISAFNNFKEVCGEKRRFEKLMDYFCNEDSNIDFMELDMDVFAELFKTKAQAPPADIGTLKMKVAQKASNKVSVLEPNRAKNLAITLRKAGMDANQICTAIETYVLYILDFLELLERFIPSDYELKLIQSYEREGRPLLELSEEDRFMVRFGKIPRLSKRISTLTFMGNFSESIQLLRPQLNAIIAASMSIKSSSKLKKILEIILAFGNYMNSGKRGTAYGFRLQSLDLLLDTKSTDRKLTLLHFLVNIIQKKFPQLHSFYTELHFLDNAALVSLDSILLDVRSLEKGMEVTQQEFEEQQDSLILRDFLSNSNSLMDSVVKDAKTAQQSLSIWGKHLAAKLPVEMPVEMYVIVITYKHVSVFCCFLNISQFYLIKYLILLKTLLQ